MKDRIFRFKLFLIGFIFVIDLLFLRALFKLSVFFNTNFLPLLIIHLSIFIIFFLLFINFNPLSKERHPRIVANILIYSGTISLLYFPKIILVAFSIIEDIFILIQTVFSVVLVPGYIITFSGLLLSVLLILILVYGMIFGRFMFRKRKVIIPVKKIPEQLRKLKILHLSDIHIGSFYRYRRQIHKAINIINSYNPDIILFSGDIVNNFSEEINGWETEFSNIKSAIGKYAVLGNHDYGDYYTWDSEEKKKENQKLLFTFYENTGFKLLMNETVTLSLDGLKLNIIGVENWGAPPFKQYGDLSKAIYTNSSAHYNILLSHDPTHWDAEVVNRTDIQLTLSGHTHGMQFGFRIGKFEWSPSHWIYKRWAGLYRENKQFLYVNRGLGFIGLPLRVGILPEITLIQFTDSEE